MTFNSWVREHTHAHASTQKKYEIATTVKTGSEKFQGDAAHSHPQRKTSSGCDQKIFHIKSQ